MKPSHLVLQLEDKVGSAGGRERHGSHYGRPKTARTLVPTRLGGSDCACLGTSWLEEETRRADGPSM